MSLDIILADVLIDGNGFQNGFATNGGSQFSYSYASCLTTSADCRISNNQLNGITNNSSSGSFFSLNNCSCNVTNNNFVRGNSLLSAYISGTGIYDQTIVGNIFDFSTTDGTNENLVNGLTSTSVYMQNKNQIGYVLIPMYYFRNSISRGSASSAVIGVAFEDSSFGLSGDDNGPPYQSMLCCFEIFTSVNTACDVQFNGSIKPFLPLNAKLLETTIGISNPNGTVGITTSEGTFAGAATTELQILVSNPDKIPQSTNPANSILDVHTIVNSTDFINGDPGESFNDSLTLSYIVTLNDTIVSGYPNFTTTFLENNTGYLKLNTQSYAPPPSSGSPSNVSSNYVNTIGRDIFVSYYLQVFPNGSGAVHMAISPLLIRYIW